MQQIGVHPPVLAQLFHDFNVCLAHINNRVTAYLTPNKNLACLIHLPSSSPSKSQRSGLKHLPSISTEIITKYTHTHTNCTHTHVCVLFECVCVCARVVFICMCLCVLKLKRPGLCDFDVEDEGRCLRPAKFQLGV